MNELEREFDAVTPQLVQKTAQEWLRRTNRTVLVVKPGAADKGASAGGAPIGGRLHALPSEIKADRLGSAEEQIVQPEYDVAAADHGEEGEPGEPAHNGKHSGEAMRAGIDRGGYIEA